MRVELEKCLAVSVSPASFTAHELRTVESKLNVKLVFKRNGESYADTTESSPLHIRASKVLEPRVPDSVFRICNELLHISHGRSLTNEIKHNRIH